VADVSSTNSAPVLTVNAGSSSLKLALWTGTGAADNDDNERLLGSGAVEGIGDSGSGRSWLQNADGKKVFTGAGTSDQAAAVQLLLTAMQKQAWPEPTAVGHRIVHGGPDHRSPALVEPALIDALRAAVPFAPLHLPSELALIEALQARSPALPQVVCFDTYFHRDLPERAWRLPLPRKLTEEGLRRYGFHGLSYEYIVSSLGAEQLGRAVIAHLGSGSSLAAVSGGRSQDTTMGFTPSGGLIMGTRTGDLDPGVLVYLLRERHFTTDVLAQLIDHEAGLLGISQRSADMQKLLAARASDPACAQAVESYCYVLRKYIGAFAAVLSGLDTLVFTGGIGEHAAEIRQETCAALGHLGIELDPAANAAHAAVISRPGGRCTVRVIATDEARMIARHTHAVLSQRAQ
jgi:acetate kinase